MDSGVLYAAFDASDRMHQRSTRFIEQASGPLVTTLPVITEVVYLLANRRPTQREFLAFADESLEIDRDTAADLPRIVEIMAKYEDLPADFADASLLALAERRGLDAIATFDRDLDSYWLAGGRPLRNLLAPRRRLSNPPRDHRRT